MCSSFAQHYQPFEKGITFCKRCETSTAFKAHKMLLNIILLLSFSYVFIQLIYLKVITKTTSESYVLLTRFQYRKDAFECRPLFGSFLDVQYVQVTYGEQKREKLCRSPEVNVSRGMSLNVALSLSFISIHLYSVITNLGDFQLTKSENFDAFLKEVGMPGFQRLIANGLFPVQKIRQTIFCICSQLLFEKKFCLIMSMSPIRTPWKSSTRDSEEEKIN